ncbi:MAG: 16S rRNA (cytidine(1402)-2'-O)-methyltransferase [Fimbriimonadaceae bacterium]
MIASPIGNLGDLSPRAADALRDADLWFVEDTRVSARLAAHLGIRKPMRIVNEHTSTKALSEYVLEIEAGAQAVLLTDAGAPAISDPGAMLADLCHEAGLRVDALPGPSAVTTALMASGFFAQRFAFLGFLPRKPGPMREELAPFADSPLTLVLFESPHRADKLLGTLYDALGVRRYAICRELTKVHQQVYRERLPHIPTEKAVPRKGEWTVVVEGRRRSFEASERTEV